MAKRRKGIKNPLLWAAIAAGLLLALLLILSYLPVSEKNLPNTKAVVEYHNYYTIDIDGKETLFFSGRDANTLLGLSSDSLVRTETRLRGACWVNKYAILPSCHGTLLMSADTTPRDTLAARTQKILETLMHEAAVSLRDRERQLSDYLEDMQYYLSVHSVQDEGYDYISQCNGRMLDRQALTIKTLDAVMQVDSALSDEATRTTVTVTPHTDFKVYYYDEKGSLQEEPAKLLAKIEGRGDNKPYWLVQLLSETTPEGAKARTRHRILPAMNNIGDLSGNSWGIGNGKGDSLALNSKKGKFSGFFAGGKRQGHGRITDTKGRTIYGVWEKGTLVSGRRHDKNGVYEGTFDPDGKASGHGIYDEPNGRYYEGHWQNDKRNVFGFSLSAAKGMSVGEWKDDVYLGERVVYTADRIYGIDISKYQHEQKKLVTTKAKVKQGRKMVWKERKITVNKIYRIDWANLRITSLGGHKGNTLTGRSEFPVSFVYIKATEGTTITNGYYNSDYAAARRHGFRVGTYHFFSLRTPAADQARHFLNTAKFNTGDFPPVLDVEPTGDMIRQIGGKDELVKRMLTWLRIVEKRVGVKPIIYVSQNFARKWLLDVPAIRNGYQVWIARYGEYKPDFKLIYWQLSPNGKVKGITGDVDINVFNGYGSQFEEFKLTKCIGAK